MSPENLQLLTAASSTLLGAAVVVATFLGPILAARGADARRLASDRRSDRMRIFRDLMGYRYDVTNPLYVAALNLVQVEFYESATVIHSFEEYWKAFSLPDAQATTADARKKAIVRLLTAVGRELGYELEQLDLMERVYSPQGWADVANEQRAIRRLFTEVALGKQALPVLACVPECFVEHIAEGQAAIRISSEMLRAAPSPEPPLNAKR